MDLLGRLPDTLPDPRRRGRLARPGLRGLARPGRLSGLTVLLGLAVLLGLVLAPAASAHVDRDHVEEVVGTAGRNDPSLISDRISHLRNQPGQAGISGCFLSTAPLFVTSGLDSVRVYDVRRPDAPSLVGVLPQVLFENEAMNCGERRTRDGVRRFALIGVDLVQASPDDISHVNTGGGELVVVDVTDPSAPRIAARVPGSTSTHTVACVQQTSCDYAYSAGSDGHFSVFDLRNLSRPREVDSAPGRPGLQAFSSPTAGHKWNFDAAGIGTHTGFGGASMWSTRNPARPRLITTTGAAGRGTDPRYPGWNDFILHNSSRPHARRFQPGTPPSLSRGNVLLVTEEDYEETDCAKAGSFQTWWVKRLDGTPGAIVPLDKVELADLGSYPLPRGAFCSSHWFDFRPGGLVAAGFYGGGTQVLDVRDPRHIEPYAHAVWGASEVWDAMWVPVYRKGQMTAARTNVVYSIDLVRGLDVYAVDVGDGRGALPPPSPTSFDRASMLPVGGIGVAALFAAYVRRRRERAEPGRVPDAT